MDVVKILLAGLEHALKILSFVTEKIQKKKGYRGKVPVFPSWNCAFFFFFYCPTKRQEKQSMPVPTARGEGFLL